MDEKLSLIGHVYDGEERHKNCALQVQYELEAVTPEPSCEKLPEGVFQNDELAAIDLTTTKMFYSQRSPKVLYKHKKEMVSIAELLETFYYSESHVANNPSSKLVLVDPVENADYIILDTCKESISQPVQYNSGLQQNYNDYCSYPLHKPNYCSYQNLVDSSTNTDSFSLVDQESQTVGKETEEVAVQTDSENSSSFPPLKNLTETEIKFTCSMCQQNYTAMGRNDRHVRAHGKIMKVGLSTGRKLQFSKKPIKTQKNGNSIVIQVPRSTAYQCGLCKKYFSSQISRNKHRDTCIVRPFLLIKCKECPTEFYTLGGINDHMNFVHKKDTSKRNEFYCVFCNESFDTSDVFHLHLDKHLSP